MDNILQQKNTVVTPVLQQIRSEIIFGKYKDNEAVRELDLAERYDCSRSAVRSALTALEKEGLITANPNGTKNVNRLSLNDIENIYALREFIELRALDHFFKLDEKDISPIIQIVNEVMNSENKTLEEILNIDALFHQSVIYASKDKAIYQAWNNIALVMQNIFHLNTCESPEYAHFFTSTFKERHVELFTSLMGKKDACVSLFKGHIDDALEVSLRAVGKLNQVK